MGFEELARELQNIQLDLGVFVAQALLDRFLIFKGERVGKDLFQGGMHLCHHQGFFFFIFLQYDHEEGLAKLHGPSAQALGELLHEFEPRDLDIDIRILENAFQERYVRN